MKSYLKIFLPVFASALIAMGAMIITEYCDPTNRNDHLLSIDQQKSLS